MRVFFVFLFSLLTVEGVSAQQLIKQSESTAARRTRNVYLVDITDGYTPETAITIAANGDSDCADSSDECCISKNGGTPVYCAGTLTNVGFGGYTYEYTSSEVDTLGTVQIRINDSAARQFVGTDQVVAFDPYVANLNANVIQWTGTNVGTPATNGYPVCTIKTGTGAGELSITSGVASANAVSASSGAFEPQDFAADGTAQGGTSTTIQLASSETYGDNVLKERIVCIVGGTDKGDCKMIASNISATDTATIYGTFVTAPDSSSTYTITGSGESNVLEWKGVAIPYVDTPGIPVATIKDGTGAGELDTSSGKVTLAPSQDFNNAGDGGGSAGGGVTTY